MKRPSSPGPQVEAGNFTRLHNHLIELWVQLRLNAQMWAVLMVLARLTYGWRRTTTETTAAAIGAMCAMKSQDVRLVLQELADANLVTLSGDMRNNQTFQVGINKHYPDWGNPEPKKGKCSYKLPLALLMQFAPRDGYKLIFDDCGALVGYEAAPEGAYESRNEIRNEGDGEGDAYEIRNEIGSEIGSEIRKPNGEQEAAYESRNLIRNQNDGKPAHDESPRPPKESKKHDLSDPELHGQARPSHVRVDAYADTHGDTGDPVGSHGGAAARSDAGLEEAAPGGAAKPLPPSPPPPLPSAGSLTPEARALVMGGNYRALPGWERLYDLFIARRGELGELRVTEKMRMQLAEVAAFKNLTGGEAATSIERWFAAEEAAGRAFNAIEFPGFYKRVFTEDFFPDGTPVRERMGAKVSSTSVNGAGGLGIVPGGKLIDTVKARREQRKAAKAARTGG